MKTNLPIFLFTISLLLFACGAEEPEQHSGKSTDRPNPSSTATITLDFLYGSEKSPWINQVSKAFHQADLRLEDGTKIQVRTQAMGSGEAIQQILSGKKQAHLVSPASSVFIKLGNAESRSKTGHDLVGATEPLVLSPVVIAMWRPMAEAIGWGKKPVGWTEILALARNTKGWEAHGYPQWGRFKFGHTHPEYSNSGLISLFAEVYAATGKVSGLTVEDVNQPKVGQYLHDIESSMVHYGRSTGFFAREMLKNGPAYLSAAVLYENMVVEANASKYQLPFPIVAIYPKEGTFWSDHPAAIVERPWVTPRHREAAQVYLDFLLQPAQQTIALQFGFHPADPSIALTAPLDTDHGVDPNEPKTTLQLPTVAVMDAIIKLWHQQKKRANLLLVFDISGSMKGEKLHKARQGAQQFVDLMDDGDTFSLLTFSHTSSWVLQEVTLAAKRDVIRQKLDTLYASGGTALYDAIHNGHRYLSDSTGSHQIRAIIALTDGRDRHSRSQLTQLLQQIKLGEKNTIRVFTIGYGSDANQAILQQISTATHADFYPGTAENIKAVFKEISTFF